MTVVQEREDDFRFCGGCRRYVSIQNGFNSSGLCRVCLHSKPEREGVLSRSTVAQVIRYKSRKATLIFGVMLGAGLTVAALLLASCTTSTSPSEDGVLRTCNIVGGVEGPVAGEIVITDSTYACVSKVVR